MTDNLQNATVLIGSALSSVRADDLGAVPIRALITRNPQVDWEAVTDDDARVNPNGGGQYALCTMCVGIGQGIALIIERV